MTALILLLLLGPYEEASAALAACLGTKAEIGAKSRMNPELFRKAFEASCPAEQRRFREEAVKREYEGGADLNAAAAVADAKIAEGRAKMVEDQAKYATTGELPQ